MLKYFLVFSLLGLAISCTKQVANTRIATKTSTKCFTTPYDPDVCPKPEPTPSIPIPNDSFDLSVSTTNISFTKGSVDQIDIDVTVNNIEFHKDSTIVVRFDGKGIANATPIAFTSDGTQKMTIKLLPTVFPCPDKIIKETFNIKASTNNFSQYVDIWAEIKANIDKFVCQFGSDGEDSAGFVVKDNKDNIYAIGSTESAGILDPRVKNLDVSITKLDPTGILTPYKLDSDETDYPIGAIRDNADNIYIAGETHGSVESGHPNMGKKDVFISKLDNFGNQKVYQFGSNEDDISAAIAKDSNGNIYVTGYTYGSLDGHPKVGSGDVFITKLDIAGHLTIYQFGSNQYDEPKSISIDSKDNIYVTGYTYGSLDGHPNTGHSDIFIAKLDNMGKITTYQFGSNVEDTPQSIFVNANDDIYVAGYTYGSLDGHPNTGHSDIFIAKLDNMGKIITYQFGSSDKDDVKGATIDVFSNIYIVGDTDGSLDGHPKFGSSDIFIAKLDLTGHLTTYQFGSLDDDFVHSITTDILGNVYVAGKTYGALPRQSNLGQSDGFILKLDVAGKEKFIQFGSNKDDGVASIITDTSSNIYLAGETKGSLDGYPNSGQNDVFIAKFHF